MELLEIPFGVKIPIIWGKPQYFTSAVFALYYPSGGVLLNTEPSHNLFLIIKRFCEVQLFSCDCGLSLKQHYFHWINEIENACKREMSALSPKAKKKNLESWECQARKHVWRALLPPGDDTKFTAVRLTPLSYSASCPFLFPSVSVLCVCSVVGCSTVGAQSRFLLRHTVPLCVKLTSVLFIFTSCI